MRARLISIATGALCLPTTYWSTRHGAIAVSVGVIVTIAVLGTWLALWHIKRNNYDCKWWALALSFCSGAVLSEAIFFVYYYIDYGHVDSKIDVGIALSLIEGGVIALLGSLSVAGTYFTIRPIQLHKNQNRRG